MPGGGSKSTGSSVSPFRSYTTGASSGSGAQASSGSSLQTNQSLYNTLAQLANWFTNQSTSTTTSPYAAPLAASGQTLINTGTPLAQESAAQMLEALRTGGVNSSIPWISRAVDAVRQGGSQNVQQTRQNLARSGMGDTLAGQAQITQAQEQANQATATTPFDLIQSQISQAPGYGASLASGGQGALASAMAGATTTKGTTTGTGGQTGTQAGSSTENISNIFNSLVQSIMNSINASSTKGVGSQFTTGTNTPSFWDLFSQGLFGNSGGLPIGIAAGGGP